MKRRRLDVEDWNGNGNGFVERMDIAGPSVMRLHPKTSDSVDESEDICEVCRARMGVDGVDRRKIPHGTTTSIKTIPPLPPSTAQSRRKPPRRPGTIPLLTHPALLVPLILPFITPTYAAPPPSRPNPTPPPTRTTKTPNRRDVQYLTSAIYPTDLPTSIAKVDETELPYILTRSSDGSWQKAEEGWQLYGRQAGGHNVLYADTDTTVTNAQATFAVQSVLPKGWGQESSRTSFYRVPLIVIASVIIALGIVAGIVVMVLNRRKAHRRAKRRAERARRKALVAAGINPDDVDGNTAEVAFKEKLGELEQQHRTKRKEAGSFVRIKVKRWNAGLRRRRGKAGDRGKEGEGSMEVLQEDGEEDVDRDGQAGDVVEGLLPSGLRRRSTDSNRSRSSPRSSFHDSGGSTPATPSLNDDTREEVEGGSSTILAQPVNPVPYFPPAYRPASVRSYQVNDAGPSRPALTSTVSEPDVIIPASETDKTRAPGYYPAPATEGAEAALAVVSRSDGKSRMIPADQEEDGGDRGVAHVATDDKRVLERMRLGGSAPPVIGEGEGPSAPEVEVDEQGFERMGMMQEEEERYGVEREEREVHPDIPAPPRPVPQRSYRGEEEVDERELLPSAPPDMRGTSPSAPPVSHVIDMPSAPPLLDEDDDVGEITGQAVPSAPDLEEEEETYDPHLREVAIEHGGEVEEEEGGEVAREEEEDPHDEIPVVTPVRYLPRYEP